MPTISLTISRTPFNVVTPGPAKAAEINLKIATLALSATATRKLTLFLEEGFYYLETAIVMKSNVVLDGRGATLIPTFTGGADDAANAVIKIDGVVNTGKLNTTLSADVQAGATSIVVVNAGTIVAGDYILIFGNNSGGTSYTGDLGFSDGSSVVLREVARVASTYVSGTTIPLAYPLSQNHASPVKATVQAIAPIDGAEITNIVIRGSLSGVVTAVGVLVQHSLRTHITDVRAEGFSRYAIDAVGCYDIWMDNFFSLGTNNGWVLYESCIQGRICDARGLDDVPRLHSQGFPREQIYLRFRCTDIIVEDIYCTNGVMGGVFHGGGVNLSFKNINVRNMVIVDDATYNRFLNSPEGGGTPGTFHGLGIGSGNGPLILAEFAHGCHYESITIDASTFSVPTTTGWTDAVPRAWAAYIHDTKRVEIVDLSVLNPGKVFTNIGGTRWSDCDGTVVNLVVKGIGPGFYTQNVGCDVHVKDYIHDPTHSSGNLGPAILLDHTSVAAAGPTFDRVRQNSSFAGFLRYGSAFLFDGRLFVKNLENDNGRWSHCFLANNASGVNFLAGDVVEIDPTHTGTDIRIRTAVTSDPSYVSRLVVVATGGTSDLQTGFMLVAPLRQDFNSAKASSALVAYGDQIVYDTANARRVKSDNAATSGVLGFSRTRKAGGSEGVITVAPASS